MDWSFDDYCYLVVFHFSFSYHYTAGSQEIYLLLHKSLVSDSWSFLSSHFLNVIFIIIQARNLQASFIPVSFSPQLTFYFIASLNLVILTMWYIADVTISLHCHLSTFYTCLPPSPFSMQHDSLTCRMNGNLKTLNSFFMHLK